MALAGASGLAGGASKVSLTVGAVSSTSVALTWSQTQDACFHEYLIEYKQASDASWTQGASFANAATTSYTVTGLSPGKSYEVFVKDTDCIGSQDSDVKSFSTPSASPGFDTFAALGALAVVVAVSLRRRK